MSGGSPSDTLVNVGEFIGLHGVRGSLKVRSHCDPWEVIFDYAPWKVGDRWIEKVQGRRQGKTLVCQLPGINDRDDASGYIGMAISVRRSALPDLPEGEWYWADLQGLEVRTLKDEVLGIVQRVFETGANDVLVVLGEREHLVPMVMDQFVHRVDLKAGLIVADWDPEF